MVAFRRPWQANLVVFVSNTCIMTLELVAGRILAPTIGVSLYTWTSIIGVILAGLSLGNYIGGKLADRIASPRTLTMLFWLASVTSLAVLYTHVLMGDVSWPKAISLPVRIVLLTAGVFFLPSVVLGTISPMVVKLTLVDLGRTGEVVGQIYAASAAGSIVGTFATGFVLISLLGTRVIVVGVAGVLFILGFLIGFRHLRRGTTIVSILAIALMFYSAYSRDLIRSPCWDETNYFCIKVSEQEQPGKPLKVLTLDRLVHSYVDLLDPLHLVYGYEQIYGAVLAATMPQSPLSAFFIGGGGYTFPRYLEAVAPGSHVVVTEIDPGVTRVAHEELGLPYDTGIITYNDDARSFLARDRDGRYDLVVGDAFNDFSVPYHLTTLEFNELVKTHLKPGGIYMVNLVDGRQGLFVRAYVRTVRRTFRNVYVAPSVSGNLEDTIRQTFVVVASDRELPLGPNQPPIAGVEPGLKPGSGAGGTPSAQDQKELDVPALLSQFLTSEQLEAILNARPAPILRDEFVPVDNLLAPVFVDSG
ncbi:MAG: fused MFS/spermidine synthase [Anaerolineae bacterium]|nr:fused MFS/spermidine synthase [Anaerolineae bacterium]